MSLAQITEKIENDARAEAKRHQDKAREQESEIRRNAEAEVKKLEEAARARFDRERPEIFKRRDIVARLDVNKLRLGAQRMLIDDVFDDALTRLKNLDKDEYLAYCERLLKEAVESGDEVMEVSAGEKFIDQAWLDRFNASNNTRITMKESRSDFSGGFVLNKGRIGINCSWEMLMQAARERLENEVVRRLFPA